MRSRVRFTPNALLAGLLAMAGCASTSSPDVDLAPARAAVAEARPKASNVEAKQCLARAEEDLKAAEGLAASSSPTDRQRATGLASSAIAGAACVDRLEAQGRRLASSTADTAEGPKGNAEAERLKARLKKSAEEQKKLEERLAILQHDLETTENEVIRTKAKLKGIETKAEASSAIAEAQTLIVRSVDDGKSRSPNLTRAQEKLELAERQLRSGNFGAAVFFALQAQDLLGRAALSHAGRAEGSGGGSLTVAVASANVRSEPRTGAPVLTKLPRGTAVVPLGENGDWLKVEAGGRTGWIAKSLVR